MVEVKQLSASEALEALELNIKFALDSLMTDEMQEMAWKTEFGFDKDDAANAAEGSRSVFSIFIFF